MIHIAVVDDEEMYRKSITGYLKKYETENGENFEITSYKDGDTIVEEYKGQFDIILMDIQLAFVDGMTAAKEIRQMDSKVVIIFLTSLAQYAVNGYEVGALDYVVKPVDYFMFSKRLERALSRCKAQKKEQYMTIPFKGGIAKISVNDIYFIECQAHILKFNGNFETVCAYGTMKELEEKLDKTTFVRVSSGCIVNLRYVDKAKNGIIYLKKYQIPLSRNKRTFFLEALTNYVSESNT